jgi:ankyrin repeat protein
MESLPLELIIKICCWITLKDYMSLRSMNSRMLRLDLVPTLNFAPYRKSVHYSGRQMMKLNLDHLDDESFVFLALHNCSHDFCRALSSHKSNLISYSAKENAYKIIICRNQDPDMALSLLNEGSISPNFVVKNQFGQSYTALTYAGRNGHLQLLKWLLADPRTDINEQNVNGFNVAHIIALSGYYRCFQLVIDDGRIDITSRNVDGNQPIHIAASEGHFEIVKMLISHPYIDINCTNRQNSTPLHKASLWNHVSTVKILLDDHRINLNIVDSQRKKPSDIAGIKCLPLFSLKL